MKRILPLIFISGCTGVGMPGSPAWFATADPSTIASHYRQQCASYGYVDGTPAMVQCVQTEAGRGRQMASARLDSVSDGMAQAAAVQQAQQPRRPINCTSVRNGVFVNTSCY